MLVSNHPGLAAMSADCSSRFEVEVDQLVVMGCWIKFAFEPEKGPFSWAGSYHGWAGIVPVGSMAF